MNSNSLNTLAEDESLLEIGRKAIEDELVERRDSRIGIIGRGNGLVIRERDRTPSDIMRMSVEESLKIGLRAIAAHLAAQENPAPIQPMD